MLDRVQHDKSGESVAEFVQEAYHVWCMSEKPNQGQTRPYRTLGIRLKHLREKRQKTLEDVSGAVEIDVSDLTEIESGKQRPSEDILMLLMNHFGLNDEESVKLWTLAGYDPTCDDPTCDHGLDHAEQQPSVKQVLVLPMDARVAYTDMAHIMVNKHGVTMNFMQEAGLGGQPLAVARIGMSHEHAANVLELLQKALKQNQKLLPPPKGNEPEA